MAVHPLFGGEIKPRSIHIVQAESDREIPRFVEDDHVVMQILGRFVEQGMFIGNTAKRILDGGNART